MLSQSFYCPKSSKAEPTVIKLIDENKFKRKFESEHPSYLRMYHYTYHYTEAGFQFDWFREPANQSSPKLKTMSGSKGWCMVT